MKIFKILISLLMLGFLTISVCTAEEETEAIDYREFTDIVSEWTPYGNMIQVGDTLIYEFDSVWFDDGGPELIPASRGDIKAGKLARVLLKSQDDNNRWSAYKIILFKGKALDRLVDMLPGDMKEEYSN